MKTKILSCLFCASIIMGSLCAVDQDTDNEERVPVGTRTTSLVENLKVQEQRAQRAQEKQKAQEEESDEVQAQAQTKEGKRVSNGAYYYTSHEGAYHNPLVVSYLGDTVSLEDGSIWIVKASDRYKTLDWYTNDTIVITPNHSWFSKFDYCLNNVNTGASVQVNLSLGPIYNGVYTYWITAIDYSRDQICLSDGSVWDISGFDHSVVKKWLPNDTIIVGIDDGVFNALTPNILINVNTLNYVSANCIY